MDPLPSASEVGEDVTVAKLAAGSATYLRRRLRRRTKRSDPERQKQLEAMVSGLGGHSSVLRSHLKRSDHHALPYTPTVRATIKRALAELRYERRQLRKMLPRGIGE